MPETNDEWADGESRALLGMLPIAKRLMDEIRAQLPDGMDFGLFLLVPTHGDEGRIVAMTTDREVVGPAVAQWFISTKAEQ
jgi:hypothetical protein